MKRTFAVMFICVVLFWPAYSQEQKPESNARVEVIDGIELVHNSGTPMYPDKAVTFVEDLSISGEDMDGNINLFNPMLKFVDNNENIYLSESKDPVIKVFGSDGKYIQTIGALGQGPGEFQQITNLAVTKEGILVVNDRRARRTTLFDSSRQLLKSFQWQKDNLLLHLIKNSSYVIGEIMRSRDNLVRSLVIKEIDFEGKEIRSYGGFDLGERKMIFQGKYTTFMSFPVSPSSIFAGDQDRSILYHCFNNEYIINVYDISGKLFRKIDRPYKPVPFTNKDAEEYRAIYRNSGEVLRKAAEEQKMPKVKNIVSRMYVDDKSNLWVRTKEIKEEEDKILTAFDIFNPDGHYYAKVWISIFPQIFKKGKMYRMDIDQDTGYQTLKRYKVVWN